MTEPRGKAVVPFVILGTNRTGTTLIATSLNSHPEVVCHGEAFKTFLPRAPVDVDDSGYLRYRQESLSRRLGHYVSRRLVVRAYLDRLYRPGPAPEFTCRAVGFKLMFNQLRQSREIFAYLQRNSIRAINVYRENSLKTWVSRLTARASGVFHASGSVQGAPVVVPLDDLIQRLERIEAEKNAWVSLVGDRLPLMRVCYESFVADQAGEAESMLRFVGVACLPLHSPLRKVGEDRLQDAIANYDEVAQALRGMPYERFLVEDRRPPI